ncbi:beta-glucosidase [Evansella caseinilytica]|uniref:Beta-glucosidase n=1 Tax=Evansella caseinilytica TaxID=1503961 RepID=A0A1H3U4I5_9BACI|nr:glycoside hydrolase family 3 N-terminal domain-containing protein [Evansella caseinilytica]SDZ57272.1 beta-glucosidase [Evansella caseinilytica]
MKTINELIEMMTIEEKAALLAGTEFWKTNKIPRLSIPAMYMTDGPCGLRKQGEKADHLGLNSSEETTSFPTGATAASSWNVANVRKMGQAIAQECHHFGVNMLLGPAVNIKRNPRCGRNFEYFSEDPYLSGEFGAAFVEGVQGEGIGVSVKHFAVNNNENYRFMGDSIVDERALREIYLKAFETIVKRTQPTTVMCAYNKVNGTYCAENKKLLTDILRTEWGFTGAVVSDWGAVSDRIAGVVAGMDLEMPGDCRYFRKSIIEAVGNGELSEQDLNAAVRNILQLIQRTSGVKQGIGFDKDAHHQLSGEIAADSAVLMKNNGSLPLKGKQEYLIIGDLFENMRYQGAGSSLINPAKLTTPKAAFAERKIAYQFVRGYRESEIEPEEAFEKEALAYAEQYDTILFFGGQTDYTESEGYDRENIRLPANQLSLLEKLAKLKKTIIFVMFGGSPVELPFERDVAAILNMYLPGQAGGLAVTQLLFGDRSPSGKLAETWMETYADVPFGDDYVTQKNELYKESIYVGYRYFDKQFGKGVKYPFGYGLSYTEFEYANIAVTTHGNKVTASCLVTNIGEYEGAEVVQLYVAHRDSEVFKAEKELRAFAKVNLKPGEQARVSMDFDRADLAYYHVSEKKWVVENGHYDILIAASSQDIRLSETFVVEGEEDIPCPYKPETLPSYYNPERLTELDNAEFETLLGNALPQEENTGILTMDSRLDELRRSFIGRIFYHAVVGVGKKQFKRSQQLPEGAERDMERKNGMFLMKMMPNNSIRSMSVSSSGRFDYHVAKGLIEMINGRLFRGFQSIFKKDRLPPLPKDTKRL